MFSAVKKPNPSMRVTEETKRGEKKKSIELEAGGIWWRDSRNAIGLSLPDNPDSIIYVTIDQTAIEACSAD